MLSYICRRKIRKHNYLIIVFLLGRAGDCSETVRKVEGRKGGEKKLEKRLLSLHFTLIYNSAAVHKLANTFTTLLVQMVVV